MTSSPARPRTGAASTVSAATAPCPVVVVDAEGHVVELNGMARDLLPAARPGRPLLAPAWLATAGRAPHPAPVTGVVGERSFSARPSLLADGGTAWWLLEDTAHRSVVEELKAERARTRFLTEASSALLTSLNLDRCMEVTARLAGEHLADAALVIAPLPARDLPVAVCDHQGELSRTTVSEVPESMPGLAEALRGFPPVPTRWIDPAAAPDWLVPEGFGEVGSLAITPLPGHGVPAGALILLRRAQSRAFTEAEEALAGLFAARAGAAMSAARLYAEQNTISDTLMRELLPPALGQVEGVEFAGGYRASGDTERIGGDFYDVHPPGEDLPETLAVLGDVAGKGLEAAVLTGKIRNTLHALLPMADDHARMLRLLNNAMRNSHNTRFATLVLASARREDRDVVLRLTSAGHPAPLIVRRDGTVEEADTGGTLIGVLPTVTSRTARVRLTPGETCLLFTDGVTEARGGPLGETMFGEERLKRALVECAGMPAEAVVERVQMIVSQWIGHRRHDDIALMAVTAPRGAPPGAVDGTPRGRFTA
ncbi:PP2C family protein-serine/threonine phosphatase [Streptomyces prasinopilosus]|uniref:Serine phosphatase RsbU, regulator of sigma subunit n=1 Tax=Streptomyces prasinopilosus TaxID=67344 RepID=A0A1G6YFN5_9ACTN|nr:GAF domain-containing SpoIIE family protein phosphatase [Streptomyces prasinopilosus]SDD89178.1 Serine phosphatase RsbU, regulator of sigma subunit [Streptomyces prasinopilosus]